VCVIERCGSYIRKVDRYNIYNMTRVRREAEGRLPPPIILWQSLGGLGFRVQGLGFVVLGFRVYGVRI
jgi:hypothetical protein